MITASTVPVSAFTNIQIRIIRITGQASPQATAWYIMLFRILVFPNIKVSYYSNNRKLVATPGNTWRHWAGSEGFWGYFWGYSVMDCAPIPFKINRLRHLFGCLLGNPPGKACWQWFVQQQPVCSWCNNRRRVGSKSTRQADGQAFAAGLLAWLQFAKARQALPALLADISGFWQGTGLRPESALNQKVIKL